MRSKDKYRSYAELHENEEEGIDFRVCMTDRAASAAVIAPHGGKIEPGTSEIATAIAGESYSLYSFEGLKPRSNQDLHITSTNFDEPRCVLLIATHNFVVSVHGLRGEHEAVDLGGLDIGLRDAACQKLKDAGFIPKLSPEVLTPRSPRETYATVGNGELASNWNSPAACETLCCRTARN
jgi:phage replication-related protein YjqB (UPF0714/DUF867 family)